MKVTPQVRDQDSSNPVRRLWARVRSACCLHSHYRRERDDRGRTWLVCDSGLWLIFDVGCGKRVRVRRSAKERSNYRKIQRRMEAGDRKTVTEFRKRGA